MRAEQVPAEFGAAAFGKRRDRNARRVRRDDRAWRTEHVRPARSSARLTSSCSTTASMIQSRAGDALEVRVESAGRDERRRVPGKKRIGLEAARALQAVARRFGGDVEQQRPARRRWRGARRSARPSCRRPALIPLAMRLSFAMADRVRCSVFRRFRAMRFEDVRGLRQDRFLEVGRVGDRAYRARRRGGPARRDARTARRRCARRSRRRSRTSADPRAR